jgi:hypothetical protein
VSVLEVEWALPEGNGSILIVDWSMPVFDLLADGAIPECGESVLVLDKAVPGGDWSNQVVGDAVSESVVSNSWLSCF